MGQAASVTRAFECQACSDLMRYVLNDCKCSSHCSDCCTCEVETDPIAVSDGEVDVELGAIKWHKK